MSIIQTIGQSEFQDGLKGEYFNFTYDATEAMYNYYEELSDSLEEPIEFDPIAIRCEWSEYDSISEAYTSYGFDSEDDRDTMDDESKLDVINENTQAIRLDNGHVLVSEF